MNKSLCCDVVEVHPQIVEKLKKEMPEHQQYQNFCRSDTLKNIILTVSKGAVCL